ncbi:MAG: hypothetical protein QXX38_01755 [Candidatus Aenigmatarchaeota archaeon]
MSITLADITPIALCIATQDILDAKRFRLNFCDNLLLRILDDKLSPILLDLKRELGSSLGDVKFLEGYKAVIISLIDNIVGLVRSRYSQVDLKMTEEIVFNGKKIIKKVLECKTFDEISKLEPEFKSKITLPTYNLFITHMKK